MSGINWTNLRSWDGSQNSAFEELCCQLAGSEPAPTGSTFFRKAAPDAGMECYWKLPNGDQWGWQAKFFLHSPDSGKWNQIEQSVKKALEKHPRLTSYTICLPIDRHDPLIPDEEWFMDKWHKHVEKWQSWSEDKGMQVQFYYWGQHEIWERLSREQHRGRHFFWFTKELFTGMWFTSRVEEAVSNVGPRYSRELNVDLPIARLFDGLGRTRVFYNQISALCRQIKRKYSKAHSRNSENFAKSQFHVLKERIHELLDILEGIEETDVAPIPFDSITDLTSKSRDAAWGCMRTLENAAKEESKKASRVSEAKRNVRKGEAYERPPGFEYERHYCYDLIEDLAQLHYFARSNQSRSANLPAVLLVGDAGSGKTHLLCDVAKQRTSSGIPTILFLGGHFNNDEPWSQMIRLLGLSCSREEFFGALEASAQASGARVLILIDALNEGEGKSLWSKYISGLLTNILRHPWLGIALSVRTSYENTVIPEGLLPNRLVREVHLGFADHEYKAARAFFDFYGIETPSVPVLVPEFQNPLFLTVFCKGLHNSGFTRIPPGLQGITAVFDFFTESVNEKLARSEYLNFDPKTRIIRTAVDTLAQLMADTRSTWLPRETAKSAVDAILPPVGYENSLFRHLISESVLVEDRFRIGDDEWCEGIHFSYERFTDHLVTKYLLDKYLDTEKPLDSFFAGQPLSVFITDEGEAWRNRGLVEALSIQLPERIKKELSEVAPSCADFAPVCEAFVQSIIWRSPTAFSEATLRYINEHVVPYDDTHTQFLNALLTVSSNPQHPYNADFLHNHLMRFELADRDEWWSTFLHYHYEEGGPIDRLVEWAWFAEDKSHITDDSVRLSGTALAWFLTASDRFLRDKTTKALVSLFVNRLHVLQNTIRQFLHVNDPYVLERLFAVAYGSTMLSQDKNAIGQLAKECYEHIFEKNTPPVDILLRDYARGVIEVAMYHGVHLDIDIEKVRPPYKSEWPSDIPPESELKRHGEWEKGMPDDQWSRVSLYNSVLGNGDFARYVIGTNSGAFAWSSRRLGEPRKPSRKELYESFCNSLAETEKGLWDQIEQLRLLIHFSPLHQILKEEDQAADVDIPPKEVLEQTLKRLEDAFRGQLDSSKMKVYDELVVPYLNDPQRHTDEFSFNLSLGQRWIFKRVLDLGWTTDKFGRFDAFVSSAYFGREGTKSERIGKKYQWIAYHEFLALASDHLEFTGQDFSKESKYEGTWQLNVRDIDPSWTLKKTEREKWESNSSTWWSPSSYSTWHVEPDDITWLKEHHDLPSIDGCLLVTNGGDGTKWIVMESFATWEDATPPGEDRWDVSRRQVWFMLRGYIVRQSDADHLFDWAKQQDFFRIAMPRARHLLRTYFGEYFWSPAYRHTLSPAFGYEEWERGMNNEIPREVLVPTEEYFWERAGYDCSITDTNSVYLPCKWIVEKMNLRWRGTDGNFIDNDGNLVAFDPSISTPGPGALLFKRDTLVEFLDQQGLDILWIVQGEKRIIGGDISGRDWKGRLVLNGTYRISEDMISGTLTPTFIA